MRPVNPSISRATILRAARSAQAQVAQWAGMGDHARAAEYQARMDALVGLLETDDCGSTGGFDKRRGQPDTYRLPSVDRPAARLDWLEGLPAPSEVEIALAPAAAWLDANQQEALSGSLRQLMRSHS